MTLPIPRDAPPLAPLPLLEIIRRKEAEVKRRLAAEREAAQVALAEAERQAREMLTAAVTEGQRAGEIQRQAAHAEAECEAAAIIAQARAEAALLSQRGGEQLAAALARTLQFIVGW
jgi:vacuolar-type H+-ATPase subunit H